MGGTSARPRAMGRVAARQASSVGGCILLLLAFSAPLLQAKPDPVASEAVRNVALAQADIPIQGVLFAFECDPSPPASLHEVWFGPPSGESGAATSTVRIDVSVTRSPSEAAECASRLLHAVAVPPRAVSGEPYASFSDRAWYSSGGPSGRLLFVRGNVVADVYVFRKGGPGSDTVTRLAALLGRKVDAAAAGRPEPVPILPLAADRELRVDLETAWKLSRIGAQLWGEKATTVALYDTNGLPRSLPAEQIEAGDYLVPLVHLLAIASPQARVKTRGDQATVSLMGKALVLRRGESRVRIGQRTAYLSRPVELAEGQVLVPLSSFTRQVLGRGIAWGRAATVPLGRLG